MRPPELLSVAATIAAEQAPGVAAGMATEMVTGHAPGPGPVLQRGAALGRYLILERLGAGGMGVVFLAYDPELDRKLALKLLHPGPAAHAGLARARLLREAQAMARLTHPNVVAVHDVGTFGGQVFVAMDFVPGQTLGAWLTTRRPDWRAVLKLFAQAGAGLAAAHAAGIVHRDFKPDNVLVGDDGRVCVTDFGLARTGTGTEASEVMPASPRDDAGPSVALTQAGAVMGTPAYMAPEQYHGESADARADQFSFCVALWEAIYGRRPFSGETLLELAHAVTMGEVQAPGRAAAPTWLRRTLQRGLAVDPTARWPSMSALLAELAHDRWRTRRRWLAGGMVAALIIGGGGGLWLDDHRATAACVARAGQARALWRDHATAIAAALRATGVPYADATWSRIDDEITTWSEAWRDAAMEACMSERTGDALAAARLVCVEQALPQLRRWVELLVAADPTIAANAAQAAQALPDPHLCREPWRSPGVALPRDPTLRGQVEALGDRLARAEALQAAGKFHEGRVLAESVRAEAEALGHLPALVPALRLTGRLRMHDSDYVGAEADLSRGFHLALATGLDVHAIEAALDLGVVVGVRLERRADAEGWVRLAESLQARLGEPGPAEHYRLAEVRGLIASAAADYPVALAEQTRALAMMERVLPTDHPVLVEQRIVSGLVMTKVGRHAEAVALFRRALVQREQALGPDHPLVARPLLGLGLGYQSLGRLDAAIAALTRARTIYEQSLEPHHFNLASVVGNLAIVSSARGDGVAALAHHRRSLELFEERLGPEDPMVGRALLNLGGALQQQGLLDEAHSTLLRALAVGEKQGPNNIKVGVTQINLGEVMLRLGRPSEAKLHFERGIAIIREVLGPGSAYLVIGEVGLGDVYAALGDHDEALRHHVAAVALGETILGPEHPELIPALVSLGRSQRVLGSLAAEATLRRALAIADTLGSEAVSPVLLELGGLLHARGQAAQAVPLLERALAVTPRTAGDTLDLGVRRLALARALWDARGDRRRARVLAEQAREGLVAAGAPGRTAQAAATQWLASRPQ